MWTTALRVAVFAALFATATPFAPRSPDPLIQEYVPGAYLFELEDGHDVSALHDGIETHGTVRMHLDYKLFKGVSVQLHDVRNAHTRAMAMASAAAPAVKNVWPISIFKHPGGDVQVLSSPSGPFLINDTDGQDDIWSPHKMTQVDKLKAEGITGKGIKIAVIDTGIDYTHPALGGCFGKGCLVSFGHDLVGDKYAEPGDEPAPDDDPRDCDGHGTHIAGIIAARPNPMRFTGAAPGVSLGAYKVSGCDGYTAEDVLIAAYNKAYEDGADIITTSMGAANGWTEKPLSAAVSRIVDGGVPCVAASGNDGKFGPFLAGTPGDGRGVIATGSFDSVFDTLVLSISRFSVDGGEPQMFGYLPVTDDSLVLAQNTWDVKLPLYATSLNTSVRRDACHRLPDSTPDLSNMVVLVRDGGCNPIIKAQNAVAKGAKYLLVYGEYGESDEIYQMPIYSVGTFITGAGMVLPEAGEAMVAALKAGHNVTVDMTSPDNIGYLLHNIKRPRTGGRVAFSSTWGPGWRMELKPTAGTPGNNITSTWLNNSYAIESGTSMAAPLMAGIVALIAEARGTLDPALMMNLLSATANPQLYNAGHGFVEGQLAPAFSQGGGLVQAHEAAHAATILEPSSLSFNDTDHFQDRLSFLLSNRDTHEITYTISHVPTRSFYTLSEDYSAYAFPRWSPRSFVDSHAALEFSETKITLHPGHCREVSVSAQPPKDVDARRLALWSGYIAINGTDGTSLSLPYQGMVGSLQNATVLRRRGPVFVALKSRNWAALEPNSTVTLPPPGQRKPTDDVFGLVVNNALGSPQLRAYMVPLTTGPAGEKMMVDDPLGGGRFKTIGQPYGLPMRWVGGQMHAIPFDGSLDSGEYAPPGRYKFVVHELRLYGDEKKLEDWDVAESQAFKIRYEG
ncbi:minor extracellular protease vpr [Purpureocillium lilacinum]|uniref:Minor extracellular protease vpr n=2 Tax=Purpureocillium lilacinum TaxID=33203 RepID=A0A179H3F9_PURLI|nr:minor extracellular protease vpr [Purpureocillium lilacinum]